MMESTWSSWTPCPILHLMLFYVDRWRCWSRRRPQARRPAFVRQRSLRRRRASRESRRAVEASRRIGQARGPLHPEGPRRDGDEVRQAEASQTSQYVLVNEQRIIIVMIISFRFFIYDICHFNHRHTLFSWHGQPHRRSFVCFIRFLRKSDCTIYH